MAIEPNPGPDSPSPTQRGRGPGGEGHQGLGWLWTLPGPIDYERAWDWQRQLVDRRAANAIPDGLLLLQHPHIYTLGRLAKPEHVLADAATLERIGARLLAVDRGGDVTYHGPGQLVGYPIVALRPRGGDVHRYLRDLEEVLIRAIAEWGLAGRREPGYTGVWVGEAKIAAIGVRVSRGVASHGFALNVAPDLAYFGQIIPCGIRDRGVTSMARLLARPPSVEQVVERVAGHFAQVFDLPLIPAEPTALRLAAGPRP